MIYYDSRYANGKVFKAYDARKKNYSAAVFREFSDLQSGFLYYTWVERDRIDLIADTFLGRPDYWWKIMDLNPEILDPYNIAIGTVIRVPSNAQ